jgi:hypothetical protein
MPRGFKNHHGLLCKSPWSFTQITMVIWSNHHGDFEEVKGRVAESNGLTIFSYEL